MKFIPITAAMFLTACATSAQVAPTNSTAVYQQQIRNVTRDVQQWHDGQYPKCLFQKVAATQIVKRDKKTSDEHWTIEACGHKQFTYKVYVMLQDGGISDMVGNADGSAYQRHAP